jgi:hypothetical protein
MIVARHEVPGVMREIASVPAGRLNGSRLRLEANKGWMVGLDPRDFNTSALQPSLRDGALCIAPQALTP